MKRMIALALTALCLTGCANAHAADTQREVAPTQQEETVQATATPTPAAPTATPSSTATPEPTEPPKATATPAVEPATEPANVSATNASNEVPVAETPADTPAQKVASAQPQVNLTYGAVPFDLAAGTSEWWQIDNSDSAYWAVAENINAMRAAAGLSALSVDGNLSAAAGSRCESFVAGGPFDHSGMTTRSEICAAGPIGSASAVCSYWQGSPAHCANIMEPSFTSMGVACWFCSVDGNNYTYWCVTFA